MKEKKIRSKEGWGADYFTCNLDHLKTSYIQKCEKFMRELNLKLAEPWESKRLDGGRKEK